MRLLFVIYFQRYLISCHGNPFVATSLQLLHKNVFTQIYVEIQVVESGTLGTQE